MSGRDLVRARRDSEPPRDPADGSRLFDLIIVLVAVAAIGSLGYFAYTKWFAPHGPQSTAPATKLVAAARPEIAWTDADTSRCKSKARRLPTIPKSAMP